MLRAPGASSARIAIAVLFLLSSRAPLVRAENPRPARPDWGTKDRVFEHVLFTDFLSADSTTIYSLGTASRHGIHSVGTSGNFQAGLHLPTGSLLTDLELDYCDSNPSVGVVLGLIECSFDGTDCHNLGILVSDDGLTGCATVTKDLAPLSYTVDNGSRELFLSATTTAGDQTTELIGAYVGYRLQIRAAPGSATFGDVPTAHLYFRAIEALAASGITGGCGGGNYCPGQNVTRGEMAAFLARALGLHFPN